MTWKFDVPLLSRGTISGKIRQFCWNDLKIWTAPIITSWNFLENKAVLLKWLENLICAYYDGLKFSQKYGSLMISPENLNCPFSHELKFLQIHLIFNLVIWIFELPSLSWSIILSNIREFWWCLLKTWPSLISQSEIFAKIGQL